MYKKNCLSVGRGLGLSALLFIVAVMVSFGIIAFVPVQAYASDLTWNTSEGLGNLNGKTVGSGKMFSGEHNNTGYPDNFIIEFKYYDSEGNIKTSSDSCAVKKGKSFSMKMSIPVEFSDFKHWQVIGTGNQLSGANPSVWVVLMPIGKSGPVTFKTVNKTESDGDAGAQTSGGTKVLTTENGEAINDNESKEFTTLRLNESEASGAEKSADNNLKGVKTQKLASNRISAGNLSDSVNSNGENISDDEEDALEDADYLDPLRDELSKAVASGKKATIYWSAGTALPRDIMLTLHDNPDITLIFSYRYEHKNYEVTIPGKNVVIEENVPWYGPLNLYGRYGDIRK